MTKTTETVAGKQAPCSSYFTALLSVALATGFVILIAVSLLFVMKNYRPTLNWDQWGDLKFLIDIKSGTFSLSELFSQNNEHRIFTARLFYLIDAFLFGYRNIFLLAVIFLSHMLLGGLIAFLWFDHTYGAKIRVAACIGGSAVLVAIVQFENLIWGFQTQFSQVYLFALLALLALGSACLVARTDRRWMFIGLYVVFYTLSALTMANGLIVVGGALMLIVFLRGRWSDGLVVVATALIVAAFYLHDYHAPAHHLLLDRLSLVPDVMLYACYFFGAPFTAHSSARMLIGGAGAGLLVITVMVAIWDFYTGRRMPPATAVLTCMSGFVFASAVLTGIGRVGSFGVEQAGSSRYATPALVFWLSIAGMTYWLFVERLNVVHSEWTRKVFAIVLLSMLFALDVRFEANADTQRRMSAWAQRIDRASVAIINNVYFTEGAGLDVLFVPPVIKQLAGQLRAYGWNIFSSRQKTYAPPIHLAAGLPGTGVPVCRGFVDSVIRLDDQRMALRGWLLASTVAQSPSWIFLRDQLGGVVGYFFALDWRADLVDKFGPAAGNGYFAAVDFKHAIPAGDVGVSFVAVFDNTAEQMCTFATRLNVPAYQIASYYYYDLQGRPIAGLLADSRGRIVIQHGEPPGFPALPLENANPLTVGPPAAEPTEVTFRFDVGDIGPDDLAIPVAANAGYDFPVKVAGSSGPIESLTLNTLDYDVWKMWRLAIIPRARLPISGKITVTIQIPAEIPPAGATIGPPFATPANTNRAALY